MATEIVMPQLGESVVEGTVGEWLKKPGEAVAEFEPVVRVSTDKVDTEIPAPAAGILLAAHVQEGETVGAGVVLGVIGQQDEAVAVPAAPRNGSHSVAAAPPPAAQAAAAPSAPAVTNYGGHVTPVVARMAQVHGLDLTRIQGSGRNGRITKKDVLAYLEEQPAAQAAPELAPWEQPGSGDLFKPTVEYTLEDAGQQAPKPAVTPAPKTSAPAPAPIAATGSIPGELVALTAMRRSIAEHMVRSKLEIAPHATTIFEVDLSRVVAHREAHKAEFARQGVKLTFTPYFVAACAVALREVPLANARWTDEGLYVHHVAHIGIAVAIDEGLIVPVLKNAQDYNLVGLARQVNDLAERARKRQLRPDEVRDGTFTITNHGVSGSLFATPIISQPQSAILGVGAIEKRVKVIDDAIAIRPCAYLSLSFDHRVLDGASADAFVAAVKRELERWA